MIKLVKIKAVQGETRLHFEVDFPDGTTKTVILPTSEITDRIRKLKQVHKEILRREYRPTKDDIIDIIKTVINSVREGRKTIQTFDYSTLLNVDLEGEG